MEDVIAKRTEALKRNPEDWESLVSRAVAFHRLGQYTFAINDCTGVIEAAESPNKWHALLVRGTAYFDMRQEGLSIQDWEESIHLNPDVSITWRNLGTAYSHQRRSKAAIQALSKAIELDPVDIHALSNLGNIYVEIGDEDKALFNHNKALKIAELVQDYSGHGLKALYSNRGFDYARLGREEEAIRDCDELVDLEPEFPFGYFQRAITYVVLGKDEKAQQDMDLAEELGMEREAIQAAFEKAKRTRRAQPGT